MIFLTLRVSPTQTTEGVAAYGRCRTRGSGYNPLTLEVSVTEESSTLAPCSACGAGLASGDRSCGECGAQRMSPSPTSFTPRYVADPVPRPGKKQAKGSRALRLLIPASFGLVLCVVIGAVLLVPPTDDALRLRNTVEFAGTYTNGKPHDRWTAYLDRSPTRLGEVSFVRRCLHETLTPREVTVATAADGGFQRTRRGWGVFTLRATVCFQDGSTRELSHRLSFQGQGSGE